MQLKRSAIANSNAAPIAATRPAPCCRFCAAPLMVTFADLGMAPPSNAYLRAEELDRMERTYPLHAYVCEQCFLVQLEQFQSPDEIFGDYAYFSSYSESWLAHARRYVEAAVERFDLGPDSQVVEVASNDGYLLQFFQRAGIPVLGVEPAANVAAVASSRGIPSLVRFFGVETARELAAQGRQADLLVGNNVLAHVPDINDFVAGIAIALKPGGVATMEFPHLLQLVRNAQFDTIYHEHFSYLSFVVVERIFAAHGLQVFDVEELPTHGGSLRIYARHAGAGGELFAAVREMRIRERGAGFEDIVLYRGFAERVKTVKRGLLSFLIEAKFAGKKIAAYGAAAKGNTLLNYCGIRTDFIDYVVDASPHKQGLYLPGTHIPIRHPEQVAATRPDYLLILPWNLKDEIVGQMGHIRGWGGKFVVPIPSTRVYA